MLFQAVYAGRDPARAGSPACIPIPRWRFRAARPSRRIAGREPLRPASAPHGHIAAPQPATAAAGEVVSEATFDPPGRPGTPEGERGFPRFRPFSPPDPIKKNATRAP